MPAADDKGLDNTHTWARTYWGGEIFWLLADVQIRVKTDNRCSVRDAIRAILNAGGDGSVDWKLVRVLKLGDQATSTTVLTDLHDQLGPQPGTVNLPDLWAKLGISERNERVHFDDRAPWAKIRLAITAPPPKGNNANLSEEFHKEFQSKNFNLFQLLFLCSYFIPNSGCGNR